MIVGYEKPPLDEVYLEHFGIKGMKWGVRKNLTKDQKFKVKATAAAGALAVASVLHAAGKLGITAEKTVSASLKGTTVVVGKISTAVFNIVGMPVGWLTDTKVLG